MNVEKPNICGCPPDSYSLTEKGIHVYENCPMYCDACNYDRHVCHFCGDSIPHGKDAEHPCYIDALEELDNAR